MSPDVDWLKEHLCSNCHAAILEQHPEFHDQIKCTLCGYTKIVTKVIPQHEKIIFGKDKDERSE